MKHTIDALGADPTAKVGNRKVRRGLPAAMLAATMLLAACTTGSGHSKGAVPEASQATPTTLAPSPTTSRPAETTTTTAKAQQLRRSDLQAPLKPTGGNYDLAADAAWKASNDKNFAAADHQLALIANPAVKAQTRHAIDVAEAEAAAWDASSSGGSKYDKATEDMVDIANPDVKQAAAHAVYTAEAEGAAWNATEYHDYAKANSILRNVGDDQLRGAAQKAIDQVQAGDTTHANQTWDALYTNARKEWDQLYNQAKKEWDQLYLHSTAYLDTYNNTPE